MGQNFARRMPDNTTTDRAEGLSFAQMDASAVFRC
jgi:hypothetical protein